MSAPASKVIDLMVALKESLRAHAASEAGRKVREAIEGEERRVAERRANPRGRGRRESDCAVVVEVAAKAYRVVNGKCAGMVVPESDTVECPREWLFGCDGAGKRLHWIRDDEAVEVTCPVCRGVGRILGIPDGLADEVQRLALVEGSSEGPEAASPESV